jgi:hypothetical protein
MVGVRRRGPQRSEDTRRRPSAARPLDHLEPESAVPGSGTDPPQHRATTCRTPSRGACGRSASLASSPPCWHMGRLAVLVRALSSDSGAKSKAALLRALQPCLESEELDGTRYEFATRGWLDRHFGDIDPGATAGEHRLELVDTFELVAQQKQVPTLRAAEPAGEPGQSGSTLWVTSPPSSTATRLGCVVGPPFGQRSALRVQFTK